MYVISQDLQGKMYLDYIWSGPTDNNITIRDTLANELDGQEGRKMFEDDENKDNTEVEENFEDKDNTDVEENLEDDILVVSLTDSELLQRPPKIWISKTASMEHDLD